MKVGLSLSFCIKDILQGNVALEDVEKIITGTCCYDEQEWTEVLSSYCPVYWKENPTRALEIFWSLLDNKQIDQPRTRGELNPGNAEGWWRDA